MIRVGGRDDAFAVAVAWRGAFAGDLTRTSVEAGCAETDGGVKGVGTFTVSGARNFREEIDWASVAAVRTGDVGETAAAVGR